jgi:hypothetical protein
MAATIKEDFKTFASMTFSRCLDGDGNMLTRRNVVFRAQYGPSGEKLWRSWCRRIGA